MTDMRNRLGAIAARASSSLRSWYRHLALDCRKGEIFLKREVTKRWRNLLTFFVWTLDPRLVRFRFVGGTEPSRTGSRSEPNRCEPIPPWNRKTIEPVLLRRRIGTVYALFRFRFDLVGCSSPWLVFANQITYLVSLWKPWPMVSRRVQVATQSEPFGIITATSTHFHEIVTIYFFTVPLVDLLDWTIVWEDNGMLRNIQFGATFANSVVYLVGRIIEHCGSQSFLGDSLFALWRMYVVLSYGKILAFGARKYHIWFI